MREINVSHAGDKALARETPVKGGGLTGMCIRVSGRSDPKSIRPHLKLNTFELKYTSVYHFKMFLNDFNLKTSNIRIFVCNQEINVLVIFDCTLN